MSKRCDIIGVKFNHLTVIKELGSRKMDDGRFYVFVEVKCDCGRTTETRKSTITSGRKQYCCDDCTIKLDDMRPIKPGTKFNYYTLIEYVNSNKNGQHAIFRCECGKTKTISVSMVSNGYVKSCPTCSRTKRMVKGDKFDRLTVIDVDQKMPYGDSIVHCLCECGGTVDLKVSTLRSPTYKTCGCNRRLNLTGNKFGKLTVIEESPNNKPNQKKYWVCACECGSPPKVVEQWCLVSGDTRSCGCLMDKEERSKRVSGENNPMHGKTGDLHPRWDENRTREQREIERATNEYYMWRKTIYERDRYRCICCGQPGCGANLNAHHVHNWNDYPDVRYSVENGVTLCTKNEYIARLYLRPDSTVHSCHKRRRSIAQVYALYSKRDC